MPATESNMLPLGTKAPDFNLLATDGMRYSLSTYADKKGLLVAFVCNHCPFVVHIKDGLANLYEDYKDSGLGFVAISSNDSDAYPEDSFENMANRASDWNWHFPYLFDESQEVAKKFRAACTPDFYLFDSSMQLVYRGQMDDSRPNNGKPVTAADLRHAIEAILAGEKPNEEQKPSIGCSIKWKPGNDPY